MPPAISIPDDPEVFPPEVQNYVRTLYQRLTAASRTGDLLRARGFRLSLEIQVIFWLTPDVSGMAS